MGYIGQTPSAVPLDGDDIADDIIDSQHYANASVDVAHMSANSVDSDQYVDGSIDADHIADNAVTLAKMASGTDGNIISFDASGNPVAIATGSDGQVLTSAGAGAPCAFEALPASGAQVYTGTFTRGQATASGNVTYSGVGFQPKALIFHLYVGNGGYDQACFGFDDGTRAYAVSPLDYNSANAWYGDGTNSIWPPESASARQIGSVSSFNSDGFVFAWTKAGSPAATSLIVFYTAIG
mgnify:FL=1